MPGFIAMVFLLLPLISPSVFANTELDQPEYAKGRILVKIAPAHSKMTKKRLNHVLKAKKMKAFSLIEGLHLYEFDPNMDVMEAIRIVSADDSVVYAEPDYIYSLATTMSSVNDPEYSRQWSLENKGQTGGTEDADINAEAMWAIETGKREVVIGIIDTGVEYTHPDLVANMWKNPGEIAGNGKDDDQNGFEDDVYGINAIKNNGDPLDDNRHGTHVAGTIGASGNNSLGVVGVAQNVQIAACKFLSKSGSGTISDAVECMQYFADLKSRKKNPVNLIATNNSWGGGGFSQSMLDAIKAHEKLGILFIAAAGNSSNNNDSNAFYPATYDVANIISVAATDHSDFLAYFSNYGQKTVHVGAPGASILSTVLNGEYGSLSGTSMAAPHVTGLAAIVSAHFPDLGYAGIKNLVIAGGEKKSALAGKTISGRRIRGADKGGVGSLTCQDQILVVKNQSLQATENIKVGDTLPISALHINCATQGGDLVVYSDEYETITLKDEGKNGDKVANDGTASLDWVATKAGTYLLRFSDSNAITVVVAAKEEDKELDAIMPRGL